MYLERIISWPELIVSSVVNDTGLCEKFVSKNSVITKAILKQSKLKGCPNTSAIYHEVYLLNRTIKKIIGKDQHKMEVMSMHG